MNYYGIPEASGLQGWLSTLSCWHQILQMQLFGRIIWQEDYTAGTSGHSGVRKRQRHGKDCVGLQEPNVGHSAPCPTWQLRFLSAQKTISEASE